MSWGIVRPVGASILAVLLLLALPVSVFAPALGDVNGNDLINIVDALQIARYDAGLITDVTPGFYREVADVIGCDGIVNIVDALTIARYDAGLIDTFLCLDSPPGQPILSSPDDAATVYSATPPFTWTNGTFASSHNLVVDDSPNFDDGDNLIDEIVTGSSSFTPSTGLGDGTYYWKVAAQNV